jgi:hypothetical protein
MYIQKKKITWDLPTTPDITSHRVYVAPEGDLLDMSAIYAEIAMPVVEAIVPDDFPPGTFDDETVNYQIGIVAFDDNGNFGDMEVDIPMYPFDVVPPPIPTGGAVVDF